MYSDNRHPADGGSLQQQAYNQRNVSQEVYNSQKSASRLVE